MAGPTGQDPYGRPYPPQQGRAPQYGAPQYGAAQYGAPHSGQPGYGPPPGGPPPRRSSAGKIIAIVVGVFVVLIVLAGVVVWQFVSGVANQVGGLTEGVATGCDAVSTADVDAALGGSYEVIQLGGLSDLAGPILDGRVLADAPTCWAVENGEGGRLARIARYSGPDAAQRFATEQKTAMGTTEDRGGGISVSTESYFGGATRAGDEAFCTTGDFTASAGVLVRRGDQLIYVSTTAAGDGAASVPQIELGAEGTTFATDKANCALAVTLAEKVR